MLADFSIEKILQYYAMLSLTLMPFTLILMIILARRTNIMDKVDAVVDKMIPDNKENQQKPEQKETVPVPTQEQIQAMSGVSYFQIYVGDSYQCHLNYINRGGSYAEMYWVNDNQFVGRVKTNGLFKGEKIGTTNIYCAAKGNGYEPQVQAYAIRVVSKYPDWFADKAIEQVNKRSPKMDVVVTNIKRKIVSEVPNKKIIKYSPVPGEAILSYAVQFDELDCLVRVRYNITNSTENKEQLNRLLEERFERIKIKNDVPISIWIHQNIDDQHSEVDVYCVLYEKEDNLYLCIGQTWREYGEKEEFLDNINLATRMFKEIVPDIYEGEIHVDKENPDESIMRHPEIAEAAKQIEEHLASNPERQGDITETYDGKEQEENKEQQPVEEDVTETEQNGSEEDEQRKIEPEDIPDPEQMDSEMNNDPLSEWTDFSEEQEGSQEIEEI